MKEKTNRWGIIFVLVIVFVVVLGFFIPNLMGVNNYGISNIKYVFNNYLDKLKEDKPKKYNGPKVIFSNSEVREAAQDREFEIKKEQAAKMVRKSLKKERIRQAELDRIAKEKELKSSLSMGYTTIEKTTCWDEEATKVIFSLYNNGEFIDSKKIKINIYDYTGRQIGTDEIYIKNLSSGERDTFEMTVERVKKGNVSYIKFFENDLWEKEKFIGRWKK